MTPVPVKETRPSLPRRAARRLPRKRTLLALAAAGAALVVTLHYLVLPWLIRDRVRAALDDAGLRGATFRVSRATLWATDVRDLVLDDVNRIDHLRVRYDVKDLWAREVHEIVVTGATLSADPRAWPIEQEKPAATTPATTATTAAAAQPQREALHLPFDRLRLVDSQLVLADRRKVPVAAELSRTPTEFLLQLHAPEAGLEVHGRAARPFDGGSVVVDASSVAGELIGALVRTYVADPPVAVTGRLSGRVQASWRGDAVDAGGSLRVDGGSVEDASEAKLTVGSGVFVGEASLGPATRPSASVKLAGVDLATPELTAYGVSGAVTLVDLDPPTSAPRQKLSAERLKVGETEFANGQLEFELNAGGDIFVRQTRWDFLGGQVYASDVQVPQEGPVSLTLRAENVELRDVLATYAKDKLDGRGKISGELPVVIDGRNITFGDGLLSAGDGGRLQIKDAATIEQIADVAGSAAAAGAARGPRESVEQIKRNVAEALRDFEYDRMTARLTNEPGGGLSAYIDIRGHGRTGAKQALHYEPRIHGLDELLRLYLDLSQSPGGTASQPTAATTTGKVD